MLSKLFNKGGIKVTVTEKTVTLVKDKKIVAIHKDSKPELYSKVRELSKTSRGVKELEKDFQVYFEMNSANKVVDGQDIVERARDYTGVIKLKGTNNPLPADIFKKFQELENKDQNSLLALLKFWYKLDRNPSKNSREQLHRFIMHNNVPITEDGDIILEKGVVMNEEGKLVDAHTRKMDNSIGRIVEMDRRNVVDDPNKTCSAGLHAAPPDYVRRWYSGLNNVLLKILVSPEDIVSVPVDYNSQKIRCCKYQVIGYSDKNKTPLKGDKVIRLEDLLSDVSVLPKKELPVKQTILDERVKSVKETFQIDVKFEGMKAKEIKAYILEHYGEEITLADKNKKGILKKAYEIASSKKVKESFQGKEQVEPVNESGEKIIKLPKTNQGLIDTAFQMFNEKIGYKEDGKKPNKEILEQRFTELFEGSGYTITRE